MKSLFVTFSLLLSASAFAAQSECKVTEILHADSVSGLRLEKGSLFLVNWGKNGEESRLAFLNFGGQIDHAGKTKISYYDRMRSVTFEDEARTLWVFSMDVRGRANLTSDNYEVARAQCEWK